jgi:hypothetical protein
MEYLKHVSSIPASEVLHENRYILHFLNKIQCALKIKSVCALQMAKLKHKLLLEFALYISYQHPEIGG